MNPRISLLQEYETQFFKFSPKGFTDTVYNITATEWLKIVDELLIMAPHFAAMEPTKKKKLRAALASMVVGNGKLETSMDKIEDFALKYTFRIPNHVTLEEDQCHVDCEVDEVCFPEERRRVMANIQKLLREIAELRIAQKIIDDEIEELEKVEVVINRLENK
ncbi:hypothetical protein AB6A40_007240 [Gnathostoma spinigerum]|uniref:Protein MIS12 homolog n=1 Tax=Gnathostoma spinigerum TaxID=75299 RepID=A0ABD6ESU3_9BILA